ncbi:MAG: type II toxin-antitoxin system RelE/ParE family toxin [Acidimicrobiia bacterium]|nr:type II toxin-antitoxin system RelE/ParE family toxin [Acidimicrobiia bacterium]
MAVVRFTDAALGDLQDLRAKDPQIVREILKKCVLLEANPLAGKPLLGGLVGFRKVAVRRHWRLVWRVTDDGDVEVAEVWAAGARSDAAVYEELVRRVDALEPSPLTTALSEIVRVVDPDAPIEPTSEPVTDPIPGWLADRLIYTAGFLPADLEGLSGSDAMNLWDEWRNPPEADS